MPDHANTDKVRLSVKQFAKEALAYHSSSLVWKTVQNPLAKLHIY